MAPAEPEARPFEQKGEVPHFPEERPGWGGYIEWEKYPEKKKEAAEILARYDFPVVRKHQPLSFRCLTSVASRIPVQAITHDEPDSRGCAMETLSLGDGKHPQRHARYLLEVC
jgi:hypothetical protein